MNPLILQILVCVGVLTLSGMTPPSRNNTNKNSNYYALDALCYDFLLQNVNSLVEVFHSALILLILQSCKFWYVLMYLKYVNVLRC